MDAVDSDTKGKWNRSRESKNAPVMPSFRAESLSTICGMGSWSMIDYKSGFCGKMAFSSAMSLGALSTSVFVVSHTSNNVVA